MYSEFYGLSTRPFQLTPDARFFFESAVHRQAMAYLIYGLHHAEGFIVITGEVGAGKTILVDNLLATIDTATFVAAKIVTSQLGADDLLHLVAAGFGIAKEGLTKGALLQRISDFVIAQHRGGRRALLIVDEAQNSVVLSARRAAHAVQHRHRQDDGVAEFPARPAAVSRAPRHPGTRTAAPARHRRLSSGPAERARHQGLYRASPAPGGLEGAIPALPRLRSR